VRRAHGWNAETERTARAIYEFGCERLQQAASVDGVPLGQPLTPHQLADLTGVTITEEGLGGEQALRLFREVLEPACLSIDHPRFLSFIPSAPTELSAFFDLAVSASSIYAGTWLEAAGAVHAENQALRWLADLAGLPPEAGGCFVSGGTAGNLSALVTAREAARARLHVPPPRWRVAASTEVHSSVATAARVIDAEVVPVEVDADFRMTGETLEAALRREEAAGVFGVVASAGTTNLGVVDDLAGVAEVCRAHALWLHVDGAYGGAALAAPSARPLFQGIEQVDSFVVDPHKWLFGPFDSCALLYREPELARRAHTQQAGYLESIAAREEWNPSDYAVHLTRRARGLPFWFSLAASGTRAYAEAVEAVLRVARQAAAEIDARTYVELVREPMLSVVAFRRLGWGSADYDRWSERLLAAGYAFVMPTRHLGETITRFALVNPRTTVDDIRGILDTMA
jgi:glutamate/tyrosine decarboxylase-like PLP-dependent enzyme